MSYDQHSNGADGTYHGVAMPYSTSNFDAPTAHPSGEQSTKQKSLQKKAQASAGTRHITRNRASYSCHACRRRKVKCDKVHPICSNCVKTGDECTYDSNTTVKTETTAVNYHSSPDESGHGLKRRRTHSRTREDSQLASPGSNGWDHVSEESVNGQRHNSNAKEDRATIEARLDRLTSMVENLTKTTPQDGFDSLLDELEPDSKATPSEDGSRLSRQLWNHRDKRHLTAENSRSASSERAGDESRARSSQSNDLVDPMGNLNLGHLSIQDGGRSRYVGTTFWAYIADEMTELNQLLRDQNKYYGATTIVNQACQGHAEARASGLLDEDSQPTDTNGFHKQTDIELLTENSHPRMKGDKSVLFQAESPEASPFKTISADMLQHVPNQMQSHALYRCYFSGVHSITPLVHPPTVLKQYEAFWDWYKHWDENREEELQPCPDPSFIPLLYAIWYGGSVSISLRKMRSEFEGVPRATLSAQLHDEVTRALTLISFPRVPSLPGLTAFLIVQTILVREEEPLTSSLFVGLALRVAQTMGLHRDPSQFGMDARESEVRRRNWWHIIYMDSVVALSSGLPPQVSDESYWDVKPISEIKDQLLGTPEAKAYSDAVRGRKRSLDNPDEPYAQVKSSMVNVSFVANVGKYAYAYAVRKILKIQLGTKPLDKKDMEDLRKILQDLETKLNERIKRIPARGIPELGFLPGQDQNAKVFDPYEADPEMARSLNTDEIKPFVGVTPVDGLNDQVVKYHLTALAAFHNWGRILLSLLIDKAYCVAYQPFLKNAKSKLWPPARQCALRHCHGFMRKFIQLASDPQFQPYTWSWPGSHQPMHASMIMLIDLYERPNSVEAPRSRALIDKVFSLSSVDGGIVAGEDGVSVQRPLREGGREAWDMLRRLRQKAWERAGLDPDVLWTEQDQIQAGVAQPPSSGELMLRAIRENTIYAKEPGSAMGEVSSLEAFHGLLKAAQTDIDAAEKASNSNKRQNSLSNGTARQSNMSPPQNYSTLDSAAAQRQGQAQAQAQAQSQRGQPTGRSSSTDFQQPGPNWRTSSVSDGPTQSFNYDCYPSITTQTLPQVGQTTITNITPTETLFTSPTTTNSIPNRHMQIPANNSSNNLGNLPPGMVQFYGDTPTAIGIPGMKTDTSPGFDWDQWDAVFGQYVPVDDFMDLDAGPNTPWSLGNWDGTSLLG